MTLGQSQTQSSTPCCQLQEMLWWQGHSSLNCMGQGIVSCPLRSEEQKTSTLQSAGEAWESIKDWCFHFIQSLAHESDSCLRAEIKLTCFGWMVWRKLRMSPATSMTTDGHNQPCWGVTIHGWISWDTYVSQTGSTSPRGGRQILYGPHKLLLPIPRLLVCRADFWGWGK